MLLKLLIMIFWCEAEQSGLFSQKYITMNM